MTLPDGGQGLDPEALENADFRLVMRGFDRIEVQRLLSAGAAEIRRLRSRLEVLAAQVAKPVSLDELTEEQLIARLGDEAVAVLHAAQETANQILARSKENADQTTSEAQAEALRLRSSAETERAAVIMNAKSEVSGAENTAAKLKHHAVHEADREIDAARAQAQIILDEANAEREAAAREVASMHAEAKDELRLLISARDEMLEAFATAGGTLRRAVEQLDGSDGDIDVIQSSLDVLLGGDLESAKASIAIEIDPGDTTDQNALPLEEAIDSEGDGDPNPEQLQGDVTEFVVEPPDELEQVRIVEGLDQPVADEPDVEDAEPPSGSYVTGVRLLDEAPEGYMPSPRLTQAEAEFEIELPEEPEFFSEAELLVDEEAELEDELPVELLVDDEAELEDELPVELLVDDEAEAETGADIMHDEEEQLSFSNESSTETSDQPSADVLDLIPRERPEELERDLGPVAEVVDIRERGERDLVEVIDPAELLGPVRVSEGGPLDPLPGEYIEGPDTGTQPAMPAQAAAEEEGSESDDIGGLFDRLRDGNDVEPALFESETVEPKPALDTPEEADELAEAELAANERQLHDPIQARDEYLLMRRDKAAEECIDVLAQRLKRVFMDEQNELLDLLRRWTNQGAEVNSEEVIPLMRSAIQRSALPGLKRAHISGAGILDISFEDEVDEATGASSLGDDLVVPLRDRIERSLLEGIEGAEGRVRAIFREWRSERLGPAVETAVLGAIGRGLLGVIDDGAMVRWVCPIGHECADGAENELIGIVPRGVAFPSGHLLAPAYSGCRCLVVPADR